MVRKKGSGTKRSRIDTPIDELDARETMMHYNAVLMEDLRSKMDLVLENAEDATRGLSQKIDSLRCHMDQRFMLVEKAIRCNKDEIERLRGCMGIVEVKLDRLAKRYDAHEGRIELLEAHS